MSDLRRCRLGLAEPPRLPQPKQPKQPKQPPLARWKEELQAAFQRPQESSAAAAAAAEPAESAAAARLLSSPVLGSSSTAAFTQSEAAMSSPTKTNKYGAERCSLDQPADNPDTTPRVSQSTRPNRARGLFKVSSFLSLRGSNVGRHDGSGGGGGGGDSRVTTPLESPMEAAAPTLPWLDLGRKVGARTSESKIGYFGAAPTPMPTPTPTLIPCVSDASSAADGKGAHDWTQWDPASGGESLFLVNAADFTWHRPSFKQIIESLQVAIVSGETVPSAPTWGGGYGAYEASEPGERRPSAAPSVFSGGAIPLLSKRWPSALPTPPAAAGPTSADNPIPGRYRSHIMCAIEGIHDMQAALDSAVGRAKEVAASRERDLEQFAGLAEEWAERTRQYEGEIRQLKEALAAARASIRSVPEEEEEEDKEDESSVLHKDDTFMSRVRAAIETSARSTRPRGENGMVAERRPVKPALICNLDHDKIVSDRMFWELSHAERNRCRQRHRWAARGDARRSTTGTEAEAKAEGSREPKEATAPKRRHAENAKPAGDESPCQSAPKQALGAQAQPDARPVRWSTSRPFSPPVSEDGNSDDDDEGGEADSLCLDELAAAADGPSS